jgi:hypothetical protein
MERRCSSVRFVTIARLRSALFKRLVGVLAAQQDSIEDDAGFVEASLNRTLRQFLLRHAAAQIPPKVGIDLAPFDGAVGGAGIGQPSNKKTRAPEAQSAGSRVLRRRTN